MRRFAIYLGSLAIVLFWVSRSATVDITLIALNSQWKYLDNGSDQQTAWRGLGFADSGWASGNAELGYGDGDEATVVSYGPNVDAKYITTYFRKTFNVSDPSLFQSLTLSLLYDDGVVAYLNGTEVHRGNMPGGGIGFTTLASVAGEENSATVPISPALLQTGSNVLAVEIHQANGTSSDISFNAQLLASTTTLQLTRGPYLQTGTPSSVVVRWRTNAPSNSYVTYGLDPSSLTLSATDSASTTEHVVTLNGLSANTRYYYSVGSTTETIAGGDVNHSFVTSPPVGTSVPTRIWVLGDSGTADANAQAVRNAYYNFAGSTQPNLWLMLGDNAYETGTDSEYQNAVFNMYPSTLKQSVLWPTLGNHDGGAADSSNQSGPYYDMFTLPKAGEAGGIASGTEAYFSFDYGNIHFINLESFETDRSATGPMMTWLQSDVNSTTQKWIVAFWHHPPYTKGSHNSDTEIELVEMRQNALPILEAAGVDLVLTGHSHSYERSFLIDGHYGTSGTFTAAMKKDGGSGREDGTGAYQKPTAGLAPHQGAVYSVAGSSGKISGGLLNHPAMFVSLNVLGSMILDVNGMRLDAKFIDNNGLVRDYFTILKGSGAPTITTTTLPDGTVNAAYSSTVNATGGTSPYSWSLASGQLPAGLGLDPGSGQISGTPSGAPGTSTFTVQVTGQDSLSSTKSLSIRVADPLTLTTTSLPNGTVGAAYSQQLAATGGTTPYNWSVVAGSLPAGLTLNASTGVIAGTPTVEGTASFTARVVDAGSPQRASESGLSITIAGSLPGTFGKSSPSNNATNRPTTLTLSWGSSSGATSYEYCVDTSNDNTCAGAWLSTGTARQVVVSNLPRRTTHYWQVRALNANGTRLANGGTWWKFTTR